ncbi:histone H1 [Microplitis demolitor]|uniref:histone H1 n=1 Tax=Microplitis demolitor TaxID=69319 RepID=UPI0004CCBF9C|nr:histone H1 [Microplitis demolitor]
MTETSVSPAPVEEKAPAKVDSPKKAAAKKPSTKATHPSAADMVTAAIKSLGERGGSSLQAIKKYIAATYKVDVEKQAPFIKKFLKAAVIKGTLVQTKGKGASGSFKLAAEKAAPKPKAAKKPAAPKKPAAAKKPAAKKATGEAKAAKKPASPKKAPVKKSEPKKSAAKTKPAASPKAKKAAKAPTAKPKSPKPKKVAAPKTAKATAKKTAAKK